MTNVLTLRLDPHSQAFFESQRQQHFPPALNKIPAHLTLFHTLPNTPEITETLTQIAATHPPFTMPVTGLRSLGRGVAYTLAAPESQTLHQHLAQAFADHLTNQDKQAFKPHVVIQNKSTPEAAKLLLASLQQSFQPFQVHAEALDLWHYLSGPWQLAQTFPLIAHS